MEGRGTWDSSDVGWHGRRSSGTRVRQDDMDSVEPSGRQEVRRQSPDHVAQSASWRLERSHQTQAQSRAAALARGGPGTRGAMPAVYSL